MSLNELITHCIQKEKRLKKDKTKSVHLAFTSKCKGKCMKRKKDKEAVNTSFQKKQQKKHPKSTIYFFYGVEGHKRSIAPTIMYDVLKEGCLHRWNPNGGERYIFIGNDKKVEADTIENFKLLL